MKIDFKDDKSNWYPEEMMEINLMAEENALVCLIGGRGTENILPTRLVSQRFPIYIILHIL